jgi:hypothetical protein
MAGKQDTATVNPATNDAYTGMLAISLCALIVGCVLLYLDYSQYPDSKAPAVPKAPGIALPQGKAEEAQPKQGEVPAKAENAAEKN